MREIRLDLDPRYDADRQRLLATWAAALDAQLRDLEVAVAGLGVEDLEWQPAPGRNTAGMLLAHVAIAEVFWLQVAVGRLHRTPRAEEVIRGTLGIGGRADGMPLAPDGGHPETLRARGLEDYLALLRRAREATHRTLLAWTDADLETTFDLEGRRVQCGWVLYHLLEHLASHLGQIRTLVRGRRGEDGAGPEESP